MPSKTKAELPAEPEARNAPPASVPESGFAAGVAAFRRGEYAAAERLLADFSQNAGGDARREDAAFLRAVARSRQGDARGAAGLAASYLKSFPNGLRRTEAERLVRAAGGTP